MGSSWLPEECGNERLVPHSEVALYAACSETGTLHCKQRMHTHAAFIALARARTQDGAGF